MTVAPLPLVIAGGGLAGGLAAAALAHRRPEIPTLLIEQDERIGGNHIWSFFDSDVDPDERWLVDLFDPQRWPSHAIRFPRRRRDLAIGYNSLRSAQLDRVVRSLLGAERIVTGRRIVAVSAQEVLLEGGETIRASGVLDARGGGAVPGVDLAWQKFVGRVYEFGAPHGRDRPTIMDSTIPQTDGFRFIYTLPFSPTRMLIEDTYYSSSPDLDVESLSDGIDSIAERLGDGGATLQSAEQGVLPVVLGGDWEAFWAGEQVARLGMRGAFFHPTTGYSLPDAVRNAALIARQQDLSGAALHRLLRERSRHLWQERRFYRLLNRMLFGAAEPAERYRVLEHFYRLPEAVIGRFYAATSTFPDKVRILSGKPPVPVGRALSAMIGRGS